MELLDWVQVCSAPLIVAQMDVHTRCGLGSLGEKLMILLYVQEYLAKIKEMPKLMLESIREDQP